jgi:hypothetical protein
MKTLNTFSFIILLVAYFLLCFSLIQKDIKILAASELLFLISIIGIYFTNKNKVI